MRAQKEDVQVKQGALNFVRRTQGFMGNAMVAKVTNVYSDRMTCDIEMVDGGTLYNIPVLAKVGLKDGEVYGRMWLPAVDDYVIIMFGSGGNRFKVIVGTVSAYLTNEFVKDAVNSGSKQFTKKLLEEGKELHDILICKSGTTFEVEEDGTIIVEVPSGTYLKISEADSNIVIEDQHGNIFTLDSSGVIIEDANGNDITMASGKVTINGNLEVLQ